MSEHTTTAPPPENVSDETFLLAYLEGHEAACPACGYNVHKLRTARCPECGITLVLRMVSSQPVRKSWLVAMVAASAAAGVGALLLMGIIMVGWPHSRDGFRSLIYTMTFPYFIAMVPAPALCLMLRRRMQWMPRTQAAAVAGVILALTLCLFLLLAWAN